MMYNLLNRDAWFAVVLPALLTLASFARAQDVVQEIPSPVLMGRVLEATKDVATIQLVGLRKPRVGDLVRIYSKLPDLTLESEIATGTVTEVRKDQILAKIKPAAPDAKAIKGDHVQIFVMFTASKLDSILYAHRSSGNSALYVLSVTGREIRKLSEKSDKPVQDEFPAWSPDGQAVVFSSDRAGPFNLWRMDVKGLKRLTDFNGTDTAPAFSPDGTRIVFARYGNPQPQLFVMRADGTSVTALSADPDIVDLDPAWSPDGKTIAYTSRRPGAQGFRLTLCDTAGQNVRVLSTADNPLGWTYPAWSPDGKKIAYGDAVDNALEIFVYDLTSKEAKQLTKFGGINSTPAWTPDGKRIALQHLDVKTSKCTLIVLDADGSHAVALLTDDRTAMSGRPAWRPRPGTSLPVVATASKLPDLVGLPAAKAKALIAQAGLKAAFEIGAPAPSPEQAFHVQKTVPAAGSVVAKGDEVKVTLFAAEAPLPAGMARVPILDGLTAAKAKGLAEQAGFRAVFQLGMPAPSKEKSLTVFRTNPAGGASAAKGTELTVTLYSPSNAKNPDPPEPQGTVVVPDCLTLSLDEAAGKLKAAGLAVSSKPGRAASSNGQLGRVYQMEPAPGARVRRGATVQLLIYGSRKE